MSENENNSGWIEDKQHKGGRTSDWRSRGISSLGTGNRRLNFDPTGLSTIEGIKKLGRSEVPPDLVTRTRSRRFKVRQYYQVDDIAQWRAWKRELGRSGSRETWVFYGCPLSMAEEVIGQNKVLPYPEFFPRVFGEKAIYFFSRASDAAAVAFKFGVESEGFLLSCRLILGRVFKTNTANPTARALPSGYDSVLAPKGTDFGGRSIGSDLYATFDVDRVLIRYVTYIVRPGQR